VLQRKNASRNCCAVPPGVTHIWRNLHHTPLEYLWIMHPVDATGDTFPVETPAHIGQVGEKASRALEQLQNSGVVLAP
jgi:hypothetical protein